MGLFCNSFCDEVCGVWVLQFLWPVLYHWAVNEGRLDESPFCFMAMESGELGVDKCFFCLVSIVLPFSNRGNCCEWGLSERLRLRVKIRFSNGGISFKKKNS